MLSRWRNKQRIRQSDFAHTLLTPCKEQEWVSIDCEMTGLDAKQHHLLTVAAIPIAGNRILTGQAGYWVCRPPHMPSEETIKIHGLRPEDVSDGVSYETFLGELFSLIGSKPLVGYHTSLDKRFLDQQCLNSYGFTLPNPCIDIATLFAQREQRKHGQSYGNFRFTHIMETLAIPQLPAHNAYNDALMTAMAFQLLKH